MTSEDHTPLTARELYDRGDFKAARNAAREILSGDDLPEEARQDAQQIVQATGIDPVAVLVFAGTGILLAYLVLRYLF